jgi:hypothetical protein
MGCRVNLGENIVAKIPVDSSDVLNSTLLPTAGFKELLMTVLEQ